MKSIQTKILVFFSIFFFVTVSLIGMIMFNNAKNLVENSVGAQAKSIAKSSAKAINIPQFEQVLVEGKNEYYYELRHTLNNLREINGLRYLYTMTKRNTGNGEEYIYVVDGLPLDADDASDFGDVEDISEDPIIKEVFETGEAMVGELVKTEDYGTLIYAYAPIKNDSGEVIGIIGADFKATEVANGLEKNRRSAIIVTLGIALLSVIVLFLLTKLLIKPLKLLTKQVEHVKEGDLTVNFTTHRKDEIGILGLAFQHMVNEMNSMINSINKNTSKLSETSERLASSFHTTVTKNKEMMTEMAEVSMDAITTEKTSEESARAMGDITQGVYHIAETALQVNDASHASVEEANLGMETLEQVSEQMTLIHNSVQESAKLVKNLDQYSVEIGKIIEIISTIASQTNLLALNAAIEAARAGENGRGFAIVADEVRKLAEQTSASLNDISKIVEKIQLGATNSVQAMEQVSTEVDTGVVVIRQSGETFKKIKESAHYVVNQVDLFTSTTQEMSASTEEVYASFEEMANVAKKSAKHINEAAISVEQQTTEMAQISVFADQLKQMANELTQQVSKFKVE